MLNKYIFYDSDSSGDADYDIKGIEYRKLLSTCLKYCTSISFCFRKTNFPIHWDERMENYRINVTIDVLKAYAHYGFACDDTSFAGRYYDVRYYRLCQETLQLLLQMSDSLFSWVSDSINRKPDDPVFYRSDGSIFFFSCVHEGYCYLIPKPFEDVSDILSVGNWVIEETHEDR